MPIIPKRSSPDVGLTTQSATPRADLSNPGAVAEARALQSVGGAIRQGAGSIALMADAEKKRTQTDELHTATISDADSYNTFVNEQSKNPDYRTDVDAYDTWRQGNEDAILNSFTDDQAKGDFKRQLDKQNIVRKAAVKEFQRDRHTQDIIGNMDETLEGFARNDMQDLGDQYITGLREGGWISGAQENQFQAQLEKAVQTQEMVVAEQIVNDTVIGIAVAADAVEEGTGWEATQKWLNDPKTAKQLSDELGMSLDEVGQVLSDVRTQASLANADKVKREEAAQAEEVDSIAKKLRKNEYVGIADFIDAQPNMTELQKLEWSKKAEDSAEAVNKNKKDPLQETNNQVYFDTITNIETMTDAKLQALTGKGLSIPDYEKLKGMLDKDSPLNRPSSKRSTAAVDRIRATDIAIRVFDGIEDDELKIVTKGEADYLAIQNELDDWKEANADDPDYDAKLEKKTKQLLLPAIEGVTQEKLTQLFTPKAEGGIPVLSNIADFFLNNEDQALAQQRLKKLRGQKVWDFMTEEEQSGVVSLVEGGSSIKAAVNEVFDPLASGLNKGITATNLKTGEQQITFDGGKTWRPL